MQPPIFLSTSDVTQLTSKVGIDLLMDSLIERLERAFKEYDETTCKIPARDGFHYDNPRTGLVEWMPLLQRGESVMMKMVGYHPDNPSKFNLPTILSTFSLFDVDTGQVKVIADGTFLTCLRTGAASAIASRILANPKSSVLGLVGAGAQAMSQLHALSRIFPLRKVLVYDNNLEVGNSFEDRMKPLSISDIKIEVAPLEKVVSESGIICTATTVEKGAGPVFEDSIPLQEGAHINAVGSDLPGKVELPATLLKKSYVSPDFLAQASIEGECQQLKRNQVGQELHTLIKRPGAFRKYQKSLTVFDSTGFALEDQVALELVYEQALKHRVGLPLDLRSQPDDPYNPYEDVIAATEAMEETFVQARLFAS